MMTSMTANATLSPVRGVRKNKSLDLDDVFGMNRGAGGRRDAKSVAGFLHQHADAGDESGAETDTGRSVATTGGRKKASAGRIKSRRIVKRSADPRDFHKSLDAGLMNFLKYDDDDSGKEDELMMPHESASRNKPKATSGDSAMNAMARSATSQVEKGEKAEKVEDTSHEQEKEGSKREGIRRGGRRPVAAGASGEPIERNSRSNRSERSEGGGRRRGQSDADHHEPGEKVRQHRSHHERPNHDKEHREPPKKSKSEVVHRTRRDQIHRTKSSREAPSRGRSTRVSSRDRSKSRTRSQSRGVSKTRTRSRSRGASKTRRSSGEPSSPRRKEPSSPHRKEKSRHHHHKSSSSKASSRDKDNSPERKTGEEEAKPARPGLGLRAPSLKSLGADEKSPRSLADLQQPDSDSDGGDSSDDGTVLQFDPTQNDNVYRVKQVADDDESNYEIDNFDGTRTEGKIAKIFDPVGEAQQLQRASGHKKEVPMFDFLDGDSDEDDFEPSGAPLKQPSGGEESPKPMKKGLKYPSGGEEESPRAKKSTLMYPSGGEESPKVKKNGLKYPSGGEESPNAKKPGLKYPSGGEDSDGSFDDFGTRDFGKPNVKYPSGGEEDDIGFGTFDTSRVPQFSVPDRPEFHDDPLDDDDEPFGFPPSGSQPTSFGVRYPSGGEEEDDRGRHGSRPKPESGETRALEALHKKKAVKKKVVRKKAGEKAHKPTAEKGKEPEKPHRPKKTKKKKPKPKPAPSADDDDDMLSVNYDTDFSLDNVVQTPKRSAKDALERSSSHLKMPISTMSLDPGSPGSRAGRPLSPSKVMNKLFMNLRQDDGADDDDDEEEEEEEEEANASHRNATELYSSPKKSKKSGNINNSIGRFFSRSRRNSPSEGRVDRDDMSVGAGSVSRLFRGRKAQHALLGDDSSCDSGMPYK